MPQPSPVTSETELFFTEGGNGVPPTYPGPDWFNVIQSELLNILKAAGIDPDKMDNTQILVALKKLFLSRSNPFGDIKADGAAAIAAALTNLGLGEAAKRNVGTGANQIPDMSLFASSNTATAAAQKFPSGLILQCGMLNSPPNASSTYGMTFPMTFSRVLAVVVTLNVTGASGQPTVSATNIHNTGFDITVSPGSVYGASSDAYYIAMGY
ncbi:gp53-like domain-containing protein [Escherichia coli]|uniref:gp53-like domain-containing protein n=1 Tax=Escherichia coli TaxID=562 RepID=UPI0035C8FDFE